MNWINDCFNNLHDLYSQRSFEAESEFLPLLPKQEEAKERIRRWM
jgi:hypothetical protein